GAVFRAVDEATGGEAAVKVLDPALYSDRNAMQRFLREGTLLRDLRHENIVRVLDVGQWEGFFYFTMEYLSGGSLAEALRDGPIPEARARQVLRDGASALRALAAAGVVHRDVKPDNLLVAEGGRVKLADFGLARGHDDTTLTRSGIIYGTPSYMSPEQIQGGEVGPRSDLYSLGATVYALVTGTPPFDGVNTRRVLFKHVFEEAPRADAARPGEVSPAFGEVLAKLLRKDPNERYATPEELLGALA
ncbi:MAG: serine/threonine protein kinase, partial [Planctomycetales bacterium]|nr:serine/threonine protein kinase [Planctomycetales bacterium]